jgi:hypothetical protein
LSSIHPEIQRQVVDTGEDLRAISRQQKQYLENIMKPALSYREAQNRLRHNVQFAVRCDVIDKIKGRRLAVTLMHPRSDGFFVGVLLVKPHSAAGQKVCARFKVGQVIGFDVGRNTLVGRVASTAPKGVWIYAADIVFDLIMRSHIPERMPANKLWRVRRGDR